MTLDRIPTYLEMIKFSHSLFALPFALCAAWLAEGGSPPLGKLVGIVGAMVAARSAAMGFNRWADRELDAANPRTRDRALPAGKVSPSAALLFVAANGLLFLAFSWYLGPRCLALAPAVLAVLLLYSYTKRWTAASHGVLGLCLALSPLGAWLAVRGDWGGDLRLPFLLSATVLLWVWGFDLIYACQDADFDRRAGLRSFPARHGVEAALWLSAGLHLGVVGLLAFLGLLASLGSAYWAGFAAVAALLVAEHALVRPADLSRVDPAFFSLNSWVSVGLFGATVLDLSLRGRTP